MVKISASDPVVYSTGKYEVIGLHVYKGLEWPVDFLPAILHWKIYDVHSWDFQSEKCSLKKPLCAAVC